MSWEEGLQLQSLQPLPARDVFGMACLSSSCGHGSWSLKLNKALKICFLY
jgi:hypothetical protein